MTSCSAGLVHRFETSDTLRPSRDRAGGRFWGQARGFGRKRPPGRQIEAYPSPRSQSLGGADLGDKLDGFGAITASPWALGGAGVSDLAGGRACYPLVLGRWGLAAPFQDRSLSPPKSPPESRGGGPLGTSSMASGPQRPPPRLWGAGLGSSLCRGACSLPPRPRSMGPVYPLSRSLPQPRP